MSESGNDVETDIESEAETYLETDPLFRPLKLPCGASLANRLVKAAMSDGLGDGRGDPGPLQAALYESWAAGGVAASILGEVQGDPSAAEKPGNLVLGGMSDLTRLTELTRRATPEGTHFWAQLGHAGAMAFPPISDPKGPSALDLDGVTCEAMTKAEIAAVPEGFARTARMAQATGFTGVEIHAAHGFLLSQFLSPLFNRRDDAHGGEIANRMRLVLDVVAAVREAVGAEFPVAIKINATDRMEGGLTQADALEVVAALGQTSVDLIDISGGTYFPGAARSSDGASDGPYFLEFAGEARKRTDTPLMLTGGFRTRAQATAAIEGGTVDVIGMARALILDPSLPQTWRAGGADPEFPRFESPPEGGVTAWYTMRLAEMGADPADLPDLATAMAAYDARDAARVATWNRHFGRK